MRFALLSSPLPHAGDFLDTLRPATRAGRLEVCPPRSARSRGWLLVLRRWLHSGWPASGVATLSGLPTAEMLERVRQEFIEALEDLPPFAADALLDRIHFARSLRELWHLRAEVFSLVSLHHDQAEADERLAWLNRHFPTRSPRSGFGPLAASTALGKDMWP